MTISAKIAKSSYSRVFAQEGASAPNLAPQYYGLARAGALSWPQGDVTPVRIPSDTQYDSFVVATTIKGQQGLPALPLEFRKEISASRMLELVQRGCALATQVHFGSCRDPRDSNAGWYDGHIIVIPGAEITDYSTSDLGALDSDQRAALMETLQLTGERLYQIKPQTMVSVANTTITDEVVDVAICDSVSCGACGLPSDGAQIRFALVSDSSGSPGLPAKVIYTSDGGSTWASSPITSLGLAEAPSAFACMGAYLVVVSNASQSHHYIKITDLLDGLGGWTEVTSGYNASGPPNAIAIVNSNLAYVVGDGGYIYKLTDPTAGATVLSAGDATAQNLNGVAVAGSQFAVAVGDSNAVVTTTNGGTTWGAITGPAVGVALNTTFAHTDQLFWIGTAGGSIYYTLNGGTDWTIKTFTSSASGSVGAIKFVTREVGYLTHNLNNVGYVLRTIDGGYSWYRGPEKGTLPSARSYGSIAVPDSPGVENVVLVGGLATDANDGVLVMGS